LAYGTIRTVPYLLFWSVQETGESRVLATYNNDFLHNDAEYGAQPKLPSIRVYLTPIKLTARALEIQNRPMIANTILEIDLRERV
jgi:hypothetical protein